MPELFRLTVLTPTRTVLEEDVDSIIVPGEDGYLGVLAHHAPLITALAPGKLTVRRGSTTREYAVGGGFLEVSQNHARLLADSLEAPEAIDVARARRAAERARARLKEPGRFDEVRAEAALKRALNRIKVAGEAVTTRT